MTAVRVFVGVPSTLDPAFGIEHDGALILRFLADPLVDHAPESGEPRPAAAAHWTVGHDGRSVVFDLRPGVLFHHGRAVTAEDYVYSLSRVAWRDTESPLAYYLSMIEGYEETNNGRNPILSGTRALDDLTLEVRLREAFHEVPRLFAHRLTAAVPAELVEPDPSAFARMPVSTGPFRLTAPCDREGAVILDRFDGYYGANEAFAAGGSGHVDRLEFRIYDDVTEAVRDWHDGELDVTKVPPSSIGSVIQSEGASFRQTPCALMQYVGFPTDIPPFNDPRLRRAVAMAINREQLIAEVFRGTREVANRIVPPVLSVGQTDVDLVGVAYDPERARELLAQCEVQEPRQGWEFFYNAGLGHDAWVELLLDNLRTGLGWKVQPRPLEWQEYIKWLDRPTGMFRMTWAMDYWATDNALYPIFHSDSIGGDNLTRFSDAAFDRLIGEARGTAGDEARLELYRAAERRACQELPLFPLWFGVQYNLVALDRFDVVDAPPVDIFGEPTLRAYRARSE